MLSICISIIEEYNTLDPESSKKSLAAWRPVIYSIISAVGFLPDTVFTKHLRLFYKQMVGLILQAHDQTFKEALHSFFMRCAEYFESSNPGPAE